MADASIIVAVIALAASTVAAVLASWSTYRVEEQKSIRDAEKLLRKYQDPLLLAARDLQARLYNLLGLGILRFSRGTENQRDALFIYTTFLVGQYFAWMQILQRQGQFIAFATGGKRLSRTHVFVRITTQIADLWNKELLDENAWEAESEPSTVRRWWSGQGRGAERRRPSRGNDGRWTTGRWWAWAGRRRHVELRDVESQDTVPQGSEHRDPNDQNPASQNLEPENLEPQNLEPQNTTAPQNTSTQNTERQDVESQDMEPGAGEASPQDDEPQDANSQTIHPQDQDPNPQEDPFDPFLSFVLWKDRQRAIGEIMATTDPATNEPICMEYSEFRQRWKAADAVLHSWFRGIPEGIQFLVDARYGAGEGNVGSRDIPGTRSTLTDPGAGGTMVLKVRLVRLQNLLVDLVDLLDEEGLLGAGGPTMSRLRVEDFLGL